ncbi:30S ribosomal protein S20 [Candidatus Tremblaya phenacola]|uniref:30S ribosomal protein S20 n=1 Tax=Candidatus Tremblayella phenacoccinincola TaxID=1010676 RepID=UPI001330ACAA|nr:30S ribosomal protein S20 [Candidatus Tremblaya phenacola]KAH0998336.1 SSU ribosomal protein S20p [Candidatus Tremblaya phenacola]
MLVTTKTTNKRITKTKRQHLNNIRRKATLRILIKKIKAAVLIGNIKEAQDTYVVTQSIIDRQTNKGLVHKNKAARCKTRLTKKINLI